MIKLLSSSWIYVIVGIAIFGAGFKGGSYYTYNKEHVKLEVCEKAITDVNIKALELQTEMQSVVIRTTEDVKTQYEINSKQRDKIIEEYMDKLPASDPSEPREPIECPYVEVAHVPATQPVSPSPAASRTVQAVPVQPSSETLVRLPVRVAVTINRLLTSPPE
jgi:hypothetical protein